MAEAKKPMSPLVKYGVGGVILFGILLKATEAPPSTSTGKKSTAFTSGAFTKKSKDNFTKEDYTAQFTSLDEGMTNAFKPLVVRNDPNSQLNHIAPNGIPAGFAAGDPNWIYTGNMKINGVPNALLENTSTGEGVVLRPNEKWRNLTLKEVGNDFIKVLGSNGYFKTVTLGSDEDAPPAVSDTSLIGITPLPAPVPPGGVQAQPPATREERRNRRRGNQNSASTDMVGPIGADLTLEPMDGGSSR